MHDELIELLHGSEYDPRYRDLQEKYKYTRQGSLLRLARGAAFDTHRLLAFLYERFAYQVRVSYLSPEWLITTSFAFHRILPNTPSSWSTSGDLRGCRHTREEARWIAQGKTPAHRRHQRWMQT